MSDRALQYTVDTIVPHVNKTLYALGIPMIRLYCGRRQRAIGTHRNTLWTGTGKGRRVREILKKRPRNQKMEEGRIRRNIAEKKYGKGKEKKWNTKRQNRTKEMKWGNGRKEMHLFIQEEETGTLKNERNWMHLGRMEKTKKKAAPCHAACRGPHRWRQPWR